MREILFRGKDSDEVWHEGFYVCHNGKSHAIYTGYAEMDCGVYYPQWFTVDPDTVGQYTGLTDKNGKKIFEGDIVMVAVGTLYIICFLEKYGRFAMTNSKTAYAGYDLCHCEVIGNIHDNPELMEVSE